MSADVPSEIHAGRVQAGVGWHEGVPCPRCQRPLDDSSAVARVCAACGYEPPRLEDVEDLAEAERVQTARAEAVALVWAYVNPRRLPQLNPNAKQRDAEDAPTNGLRRCAADEPRREDR